MSERFLSLSTIALLAPIAVATPSIDLVRIRGSQAELYVTADTAGAMRVEIALELSDHLSLTGAWVNETLFDQPYVGDNPFIDGSAMGEGTSGLWIDTEENVLFASFESGDLGAGTFEFLRFSYAAGLGVVTASGAVALDGVSHPVSLSASNCDNCYINNIFADFSGDGSVDADDLNLLLAYWGSTVPPIPDGWDGFWPRAPEIGGHELTTLLGNWGYTTFGIAAPEPSTVVMLGVIATCALCRLR